MIANRFIYYPSRFPEGFWDLQPRLSFDSAAKIGRVHAPILFIQGDRDEIIPLRLGQALYAAAPQPKAFRVVRGGGHNDIVETAGLQYREWLRSFYGMVPSAL